MRINENFNRVILTLREFTCTLRLYMGVGVLGDSGARSRLSCVPERKSFALAVASTRAAQESFVKGNTHATVFYDGRVLTRNPGFSSPVGRASPGKRVS